MFLIIERGGVGALIWEGALISEDAVEGGRLFERGRLFEGGRLIESLRYYNKEAFLRDMSDIARDVDDAVFLWEGLFKGVADEHAPLKTKRVKGKRSPWITTKLLEIRRDRDYH